MKVSAFRCSNASSVKRGSLRKESITGWEDGLKLIIKFAGLKLQRHPNMKSAFLVKLSELNQSKMQSTIAVTLEMSDFN